MELRDIEIFLVLAEELHFGRTALRLHVSQARVSQAIAKQERRIGAPLFTRTSRRVELTEVGARLREDLGAGYQRILDGVATATAAGRGVVGTLTLGLHGANAHEYASVIGLFRRRHPDVELRFHEIHFSDPFGPLRAGAVDLATTWLPVREHDITVGPVLGSEPLLLMVAAGHPLAGRGSVLMEDLGDWQMPGTLPSVPDYWATVLAPTRTPSGRPIRRGPRVTTLEETMAVVASGDVICLVHGEATRHYRRPGIVFVPIRDAPTGSWALIWRLGGETPLVRAFAQAAKDSGPVGVAAEINPGTAPIA
ncbi:LysR family transcriptional regulator [Micromonospora sp. NPDC049523]|uniref:LysR family transcriptional regulator n=1 Tax=Micromonospora sp. NPDC049523 TaxID=3155921 RepID=UPI00342248EA